MKSRVLLAMILSFVLLAVGGCDIGLMVKIRRQLSDPQQFFTNDRNGNVFAVEFIKPVIGKESLPELLGLPDRHFSEPEEKISYLLQVQGAPPRWVEVGFSFKEGLFSESNCHRSSMNYWAARTSLQSCGCAAGPPDTNWASS